MQKNLHSSGKLELREISKTRYASVGLNVKLLCLRCPRGTGVIFTESNLDLSSLNRHIHHYSSVLVLNAAYF